MTRAAHLDISFDDWQAQKRVQPTHQPTAPAGFKQQTRPAPELATWQEIHGLYWLCYSVDVSASPILQRLIERRRAAVDSSSNPLVQQAAAILRGEQPAGVDPAAMSALFELVKEYTPPAHLQKLAAKAAGASPEPDTDLDAAHAALLDALDTAGPGVGKWPRKPAHRGHDRAVGAVVTIGANETKAMPMLTPLWRDDDKRPACPACQYKRVYRATQQALHELAQAGGLWLLDVATEDDFKRFKGRLRVRRHRGGGDGRYCGYPVGKGRYVVLHTDPLEGGQAVPDDRAAAFSLLHEPATSTPDNKRVSSSSGWGGNWQGARGDGRVRQAKRTGRDIDAVQLWTTASVKDAAKALGVELKKGRSGFKVKMPRLDAYQALTAAGIALFEKDTNRAGLKAILEAEGITDTSEAAVVTHKAHLPRETTVPYALHEADSLKEPDPANTPQAEPRPLNLAWLEPPKTGRLWGGAR